MVPAAKTPQDANQGLGLAEDEKKKAQIEKNLILSYGLFMTAVTMVVPTRAPMVLAIKKGDAAATAKTMGLMSSCAAALELLINPVFGRLSDKYGRKPFLLLAPIVDMIVHCFVAAFPNTLAVNFMDRVVTGAMIFCFRSPVRAALTDLYGTGPDLTPRVARAEMFFGVGCALGPFIGAKLGGARSFKASAAVFVGTFLYLLKKFPETLEDDKKKEFDITACSPLRFLKLFRDRTTALLTTTIGLQSFGDYVNVYDINFLYLKTVMGYGQAQVGNFATSVGITQIMSGEIMKRLSTGVGRKSATALSNVMWTLAMASLGTSKSAWQLAIALFFMSFGHLRATAVDNYLQHHGQGLGMGAAEIEAAKANFTAVLKVGVPILYGNIFAWATSHGRKLPGAPYFFIAALTTLAQLTFSSIDPDTERK